MNLIQLVKELRVLKTHTVNHEELEAVLNTLDVVFRLLEEQEFKRELQEQGEEIT